MESLDSIILCTAMVVLLGLGEKSDHLSERTTHSISMQKGDAASRMSTEAGLDEVYCEVKSY